MRASVDPHNSAPGLLIPLAFGFSGESACLAVRCLECLNCSFGGAAISDRRVVSSASISETQQSFAGGALERFRIDGEAFLDRSKTRQAMVSNAGLSISNLLMNAAATLIAGYGLLTNPEAVVIGSDADRYALRSDFGDRSR